MDSTNARLLTLRLKRYSRNQTELMLLLQFKIYNLRQRRK
jgi:hypothetical protein